MGKFRPVPFQISLQTSHWILQSVKRLNPPSIAWITRYLNSESDVAKLHQTVDLAETQPVVVVARR